MPTTQELGYPLVGHGEYPPGIGNGEALAHECLGRLNRRLPGHLLGGISLILPTAQLIDRLEGDADIAETSAWSAAGTSHRGMTPVCPAKRP